MGLSGLWANGSILWPLHYNGWVKQHYLRGITIANTITQKNCLRMKSQHCFIISILPPLGGNGPPSAPQSGAPSGSMSHPGNVPSGSPYTLPPEPTLSQNPLSIMMSRMSKFAMPSSTPLYHDAIKTVASSDDDSPPARSPNLPSVNNNGKTSEVFLFLD